MDSKPGTLAWQTNVRTRRRRHLIAPKTDWSVNIPCVVRSEFGDETLSHTGQTGASLCLELMELMFGGLESNTHNHLETGVIETPRKVVGHLCGFVGRHHFEDTSAEGQQTRTDTVQCTNQPTNLCRLGLHHR